MKNRSKLWQYLSSSIVAIVLLCVVFGAGVASERAQLLPGSVAQQPASTRATFSPFWETWTLVQKDYVDRSAVDSTKLTYGAISGMLSSLGDTGHTRFLSPEALQEEEAALSGQLEGIGAELIMRDGVPTILAPLSGSPARQAGLRSGDLILEVDGRDTVGLTVEQVASIVRGPAGKPVTLTIMHKDETVPVEITIVRAKITVPSVSWTKLPGTTVGHVLVSQFAEHVTDQLVAAIAEAKQNGVTAIVLDMRNDPGGIRDEAVGVASQFLSSGNVLIEQDAEGRRTNFPVRAGGTATDLPVAVLVNEGTASAAEIVAGALQDQGRGPLIGTATVGTGTVLSRFRLSDGSAILLGTQEWLTPNGRQIWHLGIEPDIEVELPSTGLPLVPQEAASLTPDQLQKTQDTQLLRALQELKTTN